jgi:hypothetical protein
MSHRGGTFFPSWCSPPLARRSRLWLGQPLRSQAGAHHFGGRGGALNTRHRARSQATAALVSTWRNRLTDQKQDRRQHPGGSRPIPTQTHKRILALLEQPPPLLCSLRAASSRGVRRCPIRLAVPLPSGKIAFSGRKSGRQVSRANASKALPSPLPSTWRRLFVAESERERPWVAMSLFGVSKWTVRTCLPL